MKFLFLYLLIFISHSISAKKTEKVYDELYRPQFHFSPEKNWMNDPNGLVFYDGEYHLFYQYNPNGTDWGYMHWGHAVSNDLVHWENLPIALYPDNDSKDKEECTAFSGSGIIDYNNVTGLQQGNEKTILLFYTSFKCGQRLAYSNDKGRTWKKYDQNPLIPYDPTDDARDPKVFWYEPGKHFVMALYRKPDNDDKQKGISFYTSTDLIHWEFKSHIAGFFECPDLVELPVNRREDDKKWVLFDGDGSYLIGAFDGEKFTPETPKMKSDFGKNYYATQTWSGIPASDGRTIQIAWMRGGEYPDMPFNGQMSFPCELSLKKFSDGIQLIRKPVKEIELLHEKGESWENKNLIPGINKNLLHGLKGDCFHIIATFKVKTADNIGFYLRLDKEKNGAEILFDTRDNTLNFLGRTIKINRIDDTVKFEILLDRSSVEIFVNDGRAVLSTCFTPKEDALGLYLNNTGGEMLVEKMEVYPMKSIWPKEK